MRHLFDQVTPLNIAGLALSIALAGCEEQNTYVEPPPPKVTVATPAIQEVTDYLETTGTIVASAEVEIRARVAGVLKSMHFTPGTPVNAGDVLFVIEPQEYQAELQAAEAELASAKAREVETAKTLERSKTLEERGHVSQAKLDEAEANSRAAKAEVLRQKARVEQAQINLGYTQVTAPISGRVGRNLVDIGNLVGENEPTMLTTVTSYDPIFVYFTLNERDLLRVTPIIRERVKNLKIESHSSVTSRAKLPVLLALADEDEFPREGVLDFAESGLDAGTGTLQLRAVFDNPATPPELYPGLFARVRLPISTRPEMPLVLDRAIGADQSGRFVLVVNQENVVEKHNVQLGQLIDGLRVIEDGIRAEDRVVVNGIQRARPGAKVDPEDGDMAAFAEDILRASQPATGEEDPAEGQDAAEADADQEAKAPTSGEDAEAPTADREDPEAASTQE